MPRKPLPILPQQVFVCCRSGHVPHRRPHGGANPEHVRRCIWKTWRQFDEQLHTVRQEAFGQPEIGNHEELPIMRYSSQFQQNSKNLPVEVRYAAERRWLLFPIPIHGKSTYAQAFIKEATCDNQEVLCRARRTIIRQYRSISEVARE
jgi:hypothetical protein